jgi:poly(A)-specific ribonuclease
LLDFELGFSRVIKLISESKKPVVGHNMKFDILFLYHQFFKPLPASFD